MEAEDRAAIAFASSSEISSPWCSCEFIYGAPFPSVQHDTITMLARWLESKALIDLCPTAPVYLAPDTVGVPGRRPP